MAVETERQYQRELAAYNKSLQDNEDKGEWLCLTWMIF
jgi:hypothetical protein